MKFLYDYGRSTQWNAWENERVLETITKLETPCNFERWVKLDAWTMQQATCIIIGVEPDVVLGITGLYWFRKDHGHLSEGDWHIFNECVLLTCKLDKIFLELRGSYLAGKLQIIGPWDEAKTLVAPSVLTDWAKTKGYAISPALDDISINTPPTPTTEPGHDQQKGIPQLDPPESLPNEPEKYNEQLIQRGFSDEAARAYMIRNAKGPWGRITNYAALCIATGQPLPGRNDQAEKDRLNSSYTERVHYGLLGKPRPKRKKASKKD